MTYKKSTYIFFSIFMGMVAVIIGLLVSYDPLHLYHKSWIAKESRLHGNMRLQAAGIINNYDFDSMIVGTSMLKGTSSLYASKHLGGKFVNISADASNLYERNLFLEHALRNKNIKQVIYSFDTGLDANLKKNNRSLPLDKFNYLYDENPMNDIIAYWNRKFLKCMSTFSVSTECIGGDRGLIRPENWFANIYQKNKAISGLENWISKEGRGHNIYPRIKKHIRKPWSDKHYKKNLSLTFNIIDNELLNTVSRYPNTVFHIVLPPYSRFFYALWLKHNPRKYHLYKDTIKYLFKSSQTYNNLHLYILDDLDYLDNLNNYRDMRHYNTDMNRKIIDYISEKKYITSEVELERLFNELDKRNSAYPDLERNIQKILEAYAFKYNLDIENQGKGKFTIKGWALSYKVTGVELYINDKKIQKTALTNRADIDALYPWYNQKKSGFVFTDIPIKKVDKKIQLFFKNKNHVIKKITISKKRLYK